MTNTPDLQVKVVTLFDAKLPQVNQISLHNTKPCVSKALRGVNHTGQHKRDTGNAQVLAFLHIRSLVGDVSVEGRGNAKLQRSSHVIWADYYISLNLHFIADKV